MKYQYIIQYKRTKCTMRAKMQTQSAVCLLYNSIYNTYLVNTLVLTLYEEGLLKQIEIKLEK